MAADELRVDLLVIGGGSGGVRAARMAAAAGARVVLAEEKELGGTCVNVGCVPKKLFVYASHFRADFDDAIGFGWSLPSPPRFDWPTLRANKDAEIERLNGAYLRLLEDAGVEILRGRARLEGPHTARVGAHAVHADTLLIATGGEPWMPAFPGREHALISDQMFHLQELPRRILIVGGGYIAVEFAGILQGLGSEAHLAFRAKRLLRGFDNDLRQGLGEAMAARGIELRAERQLMSLRKAGDDLEARFSDGESLHVDAVLMATGRRPRTADLGLEAAGVETVRSAIAVDSQSRTNIEHIYAVGDCTDRMNLTPIALAEAMAFVDTVYRGRPRGIDYTNVPTAVFSQPEIATVGLTEEQARASHAVAIYRSRFRALRNTLSGDPERTLVKLVVDDQDDRVLGAHMLGPHAAEIVQGLAVALRCGATKSQFDSTIGIHPTTAEEFVTLRSKAAE